MGIEDIKITTEATKESLTGSSCSAQDQFVLQVLDDSMLPEFDIGNIIVIDPEAVVRDECFVFAKYDDEYIFRQLSIKDDVYTLTALNKNYPDLPIAGISDIHGVIVQGGGVRRKDRKRYD